VNSVLLNFNQKKIAGRLNVKKEGYLCQEYNLNDRRVPVYRITKSWFRSPYACHSTTV